VRADNILLGWTIVMTGARADADRLSWRSPSTQSPCGDASIFSRDSLPGAGACAANNASVDAAHVRPSGDESLRHAKRLKISTDDKRCARHARVWRRPCARVVGVVLPRCIARVDSSA